MNHVVKKQSGFTLVELMLAMSFIAVLLISIALSVVQVSNIYNKGTTLKDINQTARSVASDITRTANQAPALTLATDFKTNSGGGRLCFGTYSYIWNTAKALENSDTNVVKYQTGGTGTIHLVKVPDADKIYCAVNSLGALSYSVIRTADVTKAQELVPGGDHTLGINEFTLPTDTAMTDTTTQQGLYNLYYTIGSGPISSMNSTQTACLEPGNAQADEVYCNVQQFTIVLRTGRG